MMPYPGHFHTSDSPDERARRAPLRREDAGDLARRLARLPASGEALTELTGPLLAALAQAASPERALVNFERLAAGIPDPTALFRTLAADPRTLELLVTLFAGSQFLSEILLRHPVYLERLADRELLAALKSGDDYLAAARAALQSIPETPGGGEAAAAQPAGEADGPAFDALRRFQRWELLRIGACDLAALLDLPSVTAQLSRLADAVVQICLEQVAAELDLSPDEFAVLGMGKLGGNELNYSSDIDLLFLSAANATAYGRLGERLIVALTQATAEGFLYRVDMRLRPWGQIGPLVTTIEGYLGYLKRHARPWEKQALLKARVIAGNSRVGETFLRWAQPLLFTGDLDSVRGDVHAMKQQTEAHLRGRGRHWGEIKLGEGSIRDVEFVAQYLQLAHGAERPEILTTNTQGALALLAEAGLLSADEHRVLNDGYLFLRTVEHYLQMLEYRQTHTLPQDPAGLAYLAQRLGFSGADAAVHLVTRCQQHSSAIRAVYRRHLAPPSVPPAASQATARSQDLPGHRAGGGQAALTGAPTPTAEGSKLMANRQSQTPETDSPLPTPGLHRHLSRLSPSYAATFTEKEIARHAELADLLSDGNPVEVVAETPQGPGAGAAAASRWRVTVVAYDYLGELSLICGLLFAYGFSIVDGHVYTYEPSEASGVPSGRRKIVDVFTVQPTGAAPGRAPAAHDQSLWLRYATDLAALLRLLHSRYQREAQGELAKRVAVAVQATFGGALTLHPIDIEIDNDVSEKYTVLRIGAMDTPGFLYEFTNALALHGIHIAQVAVASVGNRVHDTLYITDAQGRKITAAVRQRELRAATVLVKHFTHLLPYSPDPETALLHFHEYVGELFRRPSWPDELASLERPEVLKALARLLGVSEFLWEDFLRMQHANLFPLVHDPQVLAARKPKAQLAAELAQALAVAPAAGDWRDALNAFKDREMFRVDMRHIQGYLGDDPRRPTAAEPLSGGAASAAGSPGTDIAQFAAELSDLAEVVVEAAYRRCAQGLQAQYGAPRQEDGHPYPGVVCALGKFGGREMGYASDLELMFIHSGESSTADAAEHHERLVREFVRAIRARREGIFEVDLQLRPYGKQGSLAVSLDAFRRYFAAGGPAWGYERQALIKLRPIAGDAELGAEVVRLRDQYVYTGSAFDVAAMRAMRERQLRHLVTAGTINAKFSQGGLVDVEYVVQGLQMMHGGQNPRLRLANTQEALAALADAGIISAENFVRLREAHGFLLRLIDALRMVRGNSRDLTVPPEAGEEFSFLARRLGYGADPLRLRVDLTEHIVWVQRLSARLLG